ncbi:MAG: hypothetical protein ACD_72C00531G0003 [uncultured bacterium]|nr:MAG: hypothetical protein ACD_72C00531G0003 [uncultured bacterium]
MFIVATATRLSSNLNILKRMILAGSDALRFNFSYGTSDEKNEAIKNAQNIISELNAGTKILVDLPSPKIRLGDFPDQNTFVKEGENLILKTGDSSPSLKEFMPIQYPKIGNIFYPEQTIIIDEGEVALKVINILSEDTIECIAMNSGRVYSFKGINFNNQELDPKNIINSKHLEILHSLSKSDIDYISCPLVNNLETAKNYIDIINRIKWETRKPKIVFKIETLEGVNNIEEIAPLCKMIILERGNLGLNTNFEKIGVIQKKVTKICQKIRKPLIISTQILESTINNFVPQRSEILDLTNITLDGVFGIMLCHETGVSMRPAYSISTAKKIITEAENYSSALLQ